MIFKETSLNGAYVINLEKYEDGRGFFARYFCKEEFKNYGLATEWVQMNISLNRKKGTFRGMHFQRPPKAESKVVCCLRGAIWDVVVDLRDGSDSYGQWFGVELNESNRTMMYVPRGFAHGFQTLSDDSELFYLHSEFYSPEHEGGLHYDSSEVGIDWPLPVNELSKRDASLPTLNQLEPIAL